MHLSFQVTKMRCWRIMTVGGGRDNDLVIGGGNDQLIGDDHDVCPQQKLELSFEYLGRDSIKSRKRSRKMSRTPHSTVNRIIDIS